MERSSAFKVADHAPQTFSVSPSSDDMTLESSVVLVNAVAAGELPASNEACPQAPAVSSYDGRMLDITLSVLLLLLLLPLMALCALGVMATSRGPLLFRHQRIGRDGQVFECLKFRTMVQNADAVIEEALNKSPEHKAQWEELRKLDNDPRVTSVGAFLRRYCLDELPQIFNILKGEMSMVGPRPIVAAEIEKYGVYFSTYCSVRPGLTGLWQVSGRHLLSYPERVALDCTYAHSRTLWVDLLILCKTAPVVLWGRNG